MMAIRLSVMESNKFFNVLAFLDFCDHVARNKTYLIVSPQNR